MKILILFSNDIILNKGLFVYDSENGIKYILMGKNII